MSQEIALPPVTRTEQGDERRNGIEIELNGLTLDRLAEVVSDQLQLKIKQSSRYERTLTGDDAGDWIVEVDFRLLKEMGQKERDNGDIADDMAVFAEDTLSRLADHVVPLELVSPPLPMSRMTEVNKLVEVLREKGAQGTSARAINAFGLQFNPEVPSTDPKTIVRYLKAFLCLEEWLIQHSEVNLTRKFTSYVAPFPKAYINKVIAAGYQPSQTELIDDYIDHNPTRNRSLDCLPLFMHLNKQQVRERCKDPLIKSRPTFHYRLPNCEIHLPEWGIHLAWQDWLQVEQLAGDEDRLHACCKAYQRFLNNPLKRWFGSWEKQLKQEWLTTDD